MGIADFHSHILPGIDDGSRDPGMTAGMLKEECRQGVDRIVATPHFYARHESIKGFLAKRGEAIGKLPASDCEPEGKIRIIAGAEVYYFPGMGRAELLNELCINGSDYLLLEMPFDQWTSDILAEVREMVHKRHLRLIMAHVERFIDFQKDDRVWDEIFSMPVIPQINTGALLNHHGRRFCLRLLKERKDVLLGTDCHNMTSRRPDMAEGRAVIEKKLGRDRLKELDVYSDSIWGELTEAMVRQI